MARKDQLRQQRTNTIINVTSRKQESYVIRALNDVVEALDVKYGSSVALRHKSTWKLCDIVEDLESQFPEVDFHYHSVRSDIRPDGGFLYLSDNESSSMHPILIAEVKHQGTNDQRALEGKRKQSRGNAIERLGKNLIGLRTALMHETIFPFVCFGYGCDFEEGSSILDRVTTMAMYGRLNETYLHHQGDGRFNRGSFYFREQEWSVDEMSDIMFDIANRSILYYLSKYGEDYFAPDE